MDPLQAHISCATGMYISFAGIVALSLTSPSHNPFCLRLMLTIRCPSSPRPLRTTRETVVHLKPTSLLSVFLPNKKYSTDLINIPAFTAIVRFFVAQAQKDVTPWYLGIFDIFAR